MKYTMMVCPHDTSQNPDKWLYFAQYLSLNSPIRVHLEMCFDFQEFHENYLQADIVYANPNDAITFAERTKGHALARPANIYDELVIVSSANQPATTIEALAGAEIISVAQMAVTGMGLRALAGKDIQPKGIRNVSSWLGVVNALREEQGSYGFLYKDTYEMLSAPNKADLYVITCSQEKLLFHSLLIRPLLKEGTIAALQQVLFDMDQTSEGSTVLKELGFTKWLPVHATEWQLQQEIYDWTTAV